MTATRPDLPPPDAADDAWLEALLATDGAAHRATYIDDAGFAARVADALPASAALPAWRRPMLTALWGAALIALVLALPTFVVELLRTANRLLSAQPFSLASIGMVLAAMVALTWGATAWSLNDRD